MKINWKDFGLSLIICVVLLFVLYKIIDPFQYLFGPTSHLLASMILLFFITSSIFQLFYLYRNKNSGYLEIFIVSFLVLFIATIFYTMILGQILLDNIEWIGRFLVQTSIISTPIGILGVLWKMILDKLKNIRNNK